MVTPGKAWLFQQTVSSRGCWERTRSEWASCFYSDSQGADPLSLLCLCPGVSVANSNNTHTGNFIISSLRAETRFYSSSDANIMQHSARHSVLSVCVEFNSSFYKGLPRIWFYGDCVECSEADKNEHIYSSRQEASWSCKRNTSEDEGWLQMTATHITAVNKIQRHVFFFLHIKEAYREAVQRRYGVPWSPETQASVLPPLSFGNGFILKVTL